MFGYQILFSPTPNAQWLIILLSTAFPHPCLLLPAHPSSPQADDASPVLILLTDASAKCP
jgi:hypothetical protein